MSTQEKRSVSNATTGVAVFRVETSHHGGYCSGAECEYESHEETFKVESVAELEEIEQRLRYDIAQSVLCEGSGYCDDSKDPRDQELGSHYSRVTLLHNPFYIKYALKE